MRQINTTHDHVYRSVAELAVHLCHPGLYSVLLGVGRIGKKATKKSTCELGRQVCMAVRRLSDKLFKYQGHVGSGLADAKRDLAAESGET